MSYINYCINLTDEEKLKIDKQTRKNRFKLKFAILFPLPIVPIVPWPQLPFFPVEGFTPQQIIRNGRDRVDAAIEAKKNEIILRISAPLAQCADACQEAYEDYRVYDSMSSTLTKIAKKVRKDKETSKSLDRLETQLKMGEFHAGRGAEKLAGTKTIFYMRAGNRGRLFFRYSETEKGVVEKLAESNKDKEQEVINNLKKNYE